MPRESTGRDFVIDGEVLVSVRGGDHMSGFPIAGYNYTAGFGTLVEQTGRNELGLSVDPIRVEPHYSKTPLMTDDFGPDIAPEYITSLAHVNIKMRLIHFDPIVLDVCMSESMGGVTRKIQPDIQEGAGVVRDRFVFNYFERAGIPAPNGRTMGRGLPLWASGNHYITLYLEPGSQRDDADDPWRFYACFLETPPMVIPLGSKAKVVELNWKAIPYGYPRNEFSLGGTLSGAAGDAAAARAAEVQTSGVVIWDRTLDNVENQRGINQP